MKTLLAWVLVVLCARSAAAQEPAAVAPTPVSSPAVQAKFDDKQPALVVLVRGGWVVIEADRPLQVGEHFHIYSQRQVRGIDPKTRADGWVPEGERTGMLVVERVHGQQGAGRLVRNAYAEVGDLVVPTLDYFRESLLYGRRFPGVWRVRIDAAAVPLFGTTTGFGLLSQAAVEYRFGVPLKLAVELGPALMATGLSLTTTDGTGTRFPGGTTFAGGLRGVLGLALSGFELSAGLGGALDTGRTSAMALQMGLGVRLGSLDGLNLTWDNTFFLPVGDRRTEFDSAVAAMNIPVHRRLTLVLASGGGLPTWAYGSIGFRIYARGSGGPGTSIVSLAIGGFGMKQRIECPPPSTGTLDCQSGSSNGLGPILHLGLDHRF